MPGTPVGSMATSTHGGTYSLFVVAGGAWKSAAAAAAAAAASRHGATPTGWAVTPPRAHLGAADTAHGRADVIDHRATMRL